MVWILCVIIAFHGLIHGLGFAKAFGLHDAPGLSLPVSRPLGLAWLLAGLLMLASAATCALEVQGHWWLGLTAVVLSQALVFSAWGDAKFGSLANLLTLAVMLHGYFSQGPGSFSERYRHEVQARLSTASGPADAISASDLSSLPEPVRRYVSASGALGQPRVHSFRAHWRGRIRAAPSESWMDFSAEQHNFVNEPARFFFMHARRAGLPAEVLHAFGKGQASMAVRLLSVWPLVDAQGPEATRAEVVTLLNDMCLLAPGSLLDPGLRWTPEGQDSARVHYTAAGHTVSALLEFSRSGELMNFTSEDRLRASADGTSFVRQPWSTPLSEPRRFGHLRLSALGKGLWHPPGGEFTYIEIELVKVQMNP